MLIEIHFPKVHTALGKSSFLLSQYNKYQEFYLFRLLKCPTLSIFLLSASSFVMIMQYCSILYA